MNHRQQRIGIIGVGLLGLAMAQRAGEHGYSVQGFDTDAERLSLLSTTGTPCDSAQQVFDTCEQILLSLPHSGIVDDVLRSVDIRPGQVIIDTTTGDPNQMIEHGDLLAARSARYAEATVAASSVQLRQGQAVMFVGCDQSTYETIAQLVERLSEKHFHLGEVGCASKFKLVHNLVLGLHRAVLAEGLTFAESLGFDPATVLDILQQTPAASSVMQTKGPKMVSRDYRPQARLSQHLKDVRLILTLAEQSKAATPLSQVHRDLLVTAQQLGFADSDNCAVIESFRGNPGEHDV